MATKRTNKSSAIAVAKSQGLIRQAKTGNSLVLTEKGKRAAN